MEGRELLEAGLRELGFGPEARGSEAGGREMERSLRYLEELERWNRIYGFVNASGEELVRRHFLDSLAGAREVSALAGGSPGGSPSAGPGGSVPRVADLGSGAGFPGIPLAIFLPRLRFTLVERSARRSAFLRNTALLLGLTNVQVREEGLESVRETFDVVTFRALTPLARELPQLRRLCGPHGAVVAYKGRLDRVEEELRALRPRVADLRVVPLRVPFLEEERHLVVFRPAMPAASPPGGSRPGAPAASPPGV